MTREEIAESLKLLKEQARKSHNDTAILNVKIESFVWVIESAIQALSQEPCKWGRMTFDATTGISVFEFSDGTIKQVKQAELEPCDDAISRILKRMWNCRGKHTTSIDKVAMEQIIRDELTSVTQKSESVTEFADRCRECGARYGKLLEQKSGKWIRKYDRVVNELYWECNKCGEGFQLTSNFCPNCGADMREEQTK